MSTNYYCGKCDIYRSPGGSFYGRNEDLCPNCLNPMYLVTDCFGCDIEFPAIEEVDGYHSLECKQLAEESWHADLIGG